MQNKEGSARPGPGEDAPPQAPLSPDWQRAGAHRFYIHSDVLFWEVRGSMNIEEIAKLYEQRSRLQREHGYALVLVDTRAHGGVPPEARRYVAMRAPNPPIRGCVVIFGMSLLGRTALALILAAARRFGRSPTTDLQLVPDEAAAWALLASWRARSLSVAAPRP